MNYESEDVEKNEDILRNPVQILKSTNCPISESLDRKMCIHKRFCELKIILFRISMKANQKLKNQIIFMSIIITEENNLSTSETDRFNNNIEEYTRVVKDDRIKTVDDFRDTKIKTPYFSEDNVDTLSHKAVDEERVFCSTASTEVNIIFFAFFAINSF